MKIEKITENKIKIFLDLNDLATNNIDIHTFMANPIKSQEFFFDILKEAKKEIGFSTDNYKLTIEAIASNQGSFILTITRSSLNKFSGNSSLKIKRKIPNLDTSIEIYSFESFDIFCNFCKYISKTSLNNLKSFSKKINLYLYKKHYYLAISDINPQYSYITYFFSIISEFANNISNSEVFNSKLTEHGKLIFKNNAIETCNSFFIKKN